MNTKSHSYVNLHRLMEPFVITTRGISINVHGMLLMLSVLFVVRFLIQRKIVHKEMVYFSFLVLFRFFTLYYGYCIITYVWC